MVRNSSTLAATVAAGDTEYWYIEAAGKDAVRVDISADGSPYDVDVLTGGNHPPRGSFDANDYTSILSAAQTFEDTNNHTVGGDAVSRSVAVAVTNNSGAQITVDGEINTHEPADAESAAAFLADGVSAVGKTVVDGNETGPGASPRSKPAKADYLAVRNVQDDFVPEGAIADLRNYGGPFIAGTASTGSFVTVTSDTVQVSGTSATPQTTSASASVSPSGLAAPQGLVSFFTPTTTLTHTVVLDYTGNQNVAPPIQPVVRYNSSGVTTTTTFQPSSVPTTFTVGHSPNSSAISVFFEAVPGSIGPDVQYYDSAASTVTTRNLRTGAVFYGSGGLTAEIQPDDGSVGFYNVAATAYGHNFNFGTINQRYDPYS